MSGPGGLAAGVSGAPDLWRSAAGRADDDDERAPPLSVPDVRAASSLLAVENVQVSLGLGQWRAGGHSIYFDARQDADLLVCARFPE